MPKVLAPIAVALLLLAPGCFLSRTMVHEPIGRESLAALEPGRTTAKEVVETLGAPSEVVQLGARTAYRYDFSVQKRAGLTLIVVTFLNEDTRADRAWLFFDASEVLTHAGSTLQAEDARYAMPWQKVHGR